MLCDPAENPEQSGIRRLVANIGLPGLSMLIPPTNPRMRKPEFEAWRVVNHRLFDGKVVDNFENTSIHLSFTGYESPVPGAINHGDHDAEANFIETLAQVYDGSRWVADIDILGSLSSQWCLQARSPKPCRHIRSTAPSPETTMIDNWDELLDPPNTPAIVRAKGNYIARLAATAFSVHMRHQTYILPENVCWACTEWQRGTWPGLDEEENEDEDEEEKVLIVIL